MPPNPVPAQGTQICGKPCRFQRDSYEQKKPTWYIYFEEETWSKITTQKETPGNRLIHSWREKKMSERTPRATHCCVQINLDD